ncbi:hypothetical protein CPB86DRAFT_736401 [Serendipita vermifera]|nr:hypothetical protein CPB86DRAFT_736401 [Serendipita vermifera]
MSFAAGTVAGAILAGGVYYSFSYRLRNSTLQYKSTLHDLSQEMINPQTGIHIPPSAAERIPRSDTFGGLVKQQWNETVGNAFQKATDWRPSRG